MAPTHVRSAPPPPTTTPQGFTIGKGNLIGIAGCLLMTAVVLLVIGLSIESDIKVERRYANYEKARLQAHQKTLFQTTVAESMDNAAHEAKLVKLLSMMQNTFTKEKEGVDLLGMFEGRYDVGIKMHKEAIDSGLKKLKGNPTVVKYLTAELYTAATDLSDRAMELTQQVGNLLVGQLVSTRLLACNQC